MPGDMSGDSVPGLSAAYTLTLLMVLAAPAALAQPAPGNAKEQRSSTAQKKMPDKASTDTRQIKQGQQEARNKNAQKMDAANRDLATGVASGAQGSAAMPAKKPSSPGKVTQDARKPALPAQPDALKK